jgi:hypothetical protein
LGWLRAPISAGVLSAVGHCGRRSSARHRLTSPWSRTAPWLEPDLKTAAHLGLSLTEAVVAEKMTGPAPPATMPSNAGTPDKPGFQSGGGRAPPPRGVQAPLRQSLYISSPSARAVTTPHASAIPGSPTRSPIRHQTIDTRTGRRPAAPRVNRPYDLAGGHGWAQGSLDADDPMAWEKQDTPPLTADQVTSNCSCFHPAKVAGSGRCIRGGRPGPYS